jgi:hypothetical protein
VQLRNKGFNGNNCSRVQQQPLEQQPRTLLQL